MKDIYHFLHVGKTGGCALIHALSPYSGANGGNLRLHLHPFKMKDVPKDEHVFLNVRDPEKRFISAFYYVKRHHAPREVVPVPWNKYEKSFFKAFITPNLALEALTHGNPELRKIAEEGIKHAWHMRDRQVSWVNGMDYLKENINQIFHVNFNETYNEDFKRLLEKLNLPDIELPRDERIANIGVNEKDDKELSPKALQNLKTWYKEDYELYDFLQELKKEGKI
jgi:hypothetical protein